MYFILSQLFTSVLPWELLYIVVWMLVVEKYEALKEKVEQWRNGMESKRLRVDMKKIKVVIDSVDEVSVMRSGQWPCAVCKKEYGIH